MKKWNATVSENLRNLLQIAADTSNLHIRNQNRELNAPQMGTWMLYAASINDGFSEYERYPKINLKDCSFFTTPEAKKSKITNHSPDTASSSSSSSSSATTMSSSSSNCF